MRNINSPFYPYEKVFTSYLNLAETQTLLRQICDYLIDAPQGDYTPQDNNEFARCRMWKYLYYDCERPLSQPLPNIKDKMSVLFNPAQPEEPPTDKGYRLIPQIYIEPSQEIAQTRLMFTTGRTVPSDNPFKACLSIVFYIWTNQSYETNTKDGGLSRSQSIELALIDAFNGLNMQGIGTFFFDRRKHADCGSAVIYDGQTNVGRKVTMALEIATFENKQPDTDDLPPLGIGNNIKIF